MVEELTEEVLRSGMEPKWESVWWNSTRVGEEDKPMVLKGAGKCCVLPFVEDFDMQVQEEWEEF